MHFKRVSLFTQDSYFSFRIMKIIQEIKTLFLDLTINIVPPKTHNQYKPSFLNLLD